MIGIFCNVPHSQNCNLQMSGGSDGNNCKYFISLFKECILSCFFTGWHSSEGRLTLHNSADFLVELSKLFNFTFFPDKLSSVCNLFCVTEFALLHVHCFNSICLLLVHCPVILNVCWLLSLQILSFAQNWSLFWTVWSNLLICPALRRLADFQLANFWNPSSLIVSNTTELMVLLSRKWSICYRWSMVKIHWLQEQ